MTLTMKAPTQVTYFYNKLVALKTNLYGYAHPDQFPDGLPQPELHMLTAIDGRVYDGWIVWVERVSTSLARVRIGNDVFDTILVHIK